jgi:hypothetical protein
MLKKIIKINKMKYLTKIHATVVLSEIPLDLKFDVDPSDWLLADEDNQAKIIWHHIRDKYPLNFKIACKVTLDHPKSSYVADWVITN